MSDSEKLAATTEGRLGLSVAWSYAFAVLLVLFVFLIWVPDSDGPSPWDSGAFQSSVLEFLANLRLLDEAADLGIVRVADIGEGWIDAELDLMVVSIRDFGWAPFYLALGLVSVALVLRGIRQRLLSSHLGVPTAAKGQLSSYFFGRGMNLFFPFGAGEAGAAENLVAGGADHAMASSVIFHNRLFEVLAILIVLAGGFLYSGWQGTVVPMFWGTVLVVAVVSLTRPLGRRNTSGSRFNVFRQVWTAFNGPALAEATHRLSGHPGRLFGLLLLAASTLMVEVLGYWCIKQAFSSPMDDYVLMKDLGFAEFMIVVAVANTARILPYTAASLGIYEVVSMAMFQVFGEGPLSGATISFLDSALVNTLTLVSFLAVLLMGHCPSVLETWRRFFRQSAVREQTGPTIMGTT